MPGCKANPGRCSMGHSLNLNVYYCRWPFIGCWCGRSCCQSFLSCRQGSNPTLQGELTAGRAGPWLADMPAGRVNTNRAHESNRMNPQRQSSLRAFKATARLRSLPLSRNEVSSALDKVLTEGILHVVRSGPTILRNGSTRRHAGFSPRPCAHGK